MTHTVYSSKFGTKHQHRQYLLHIFAVLCDLNAACVVCVDCVRVFTVYYQRRVSLNVRYHYMPMPVAAFMRYSLLYVVFVVRVRSSRKNFTFAISSSGELLVLFRCSATARCIICVTLDARLQSIKVKK